MLTHHANDDAERMIKGDPGAESVFFWNKEQKNVDRRGAGPMDASIYGRGAGEGLGVHICTGPGRRPRCGARRRARGAHPGRRAAAVRQSRSSRQGFGSNAAAWWGYHYNDLLTEPKPREVITIYEVDATGERNWAQAVYNFRWTPQTDPFGVVHKTIDYPGVPVDHSTIQKNFGILKNVRVPIRPHFGVIGAGAARGRHGRLDPARLFRRQHRQLAHRQGRHHVLPGRGRRARCSRSAIRTPRRATPSCAARAIECSLTGTFQLILHKKAALAGTALEGLDFPMLETQDDWVVHGFSYANYLAELGPDAQCEIYEQVLGRPRHARRLPQDAPLPDEHQGPHRGRGDLADVDRRRLRRDPGGRRQLGRPRDHQEEPVRRRGVRLGIDGAGAERAAVPAAWLHSANDSCGFTVWRSTFLP